MQNTTKIVFFVAQIRQFYFMEDATFASFTGHLVYPLGL